MNAGRWSLAPLGGILFVIGVVVASVIAGETPELDAPAAQLVDFYEDNSDKLFAAAVIQAWSAVLLIVFSIAVRLRLDGAGGLGWPGALVMAGGITTAVGTLFDSVLRGALAEAGSDGQAEVLQTLQYMSEFSFFPLAGGIALLTFGLAIGVLRTGFLPRWLGYVAMVGAVLALSPLFFVGLPIAALMVIATSVVLARPTAPVTSASTT